MKPTRLTEFMSKLTPNSVAVIAGNRELRRNGFDNDYDFRQDTDFFYLTRLNEPDCVAVISPDDPEHKYVLFVRPRIHEEEIWTGLRTGIDGAIKNYGADAAYDIADLDKYLFEYVANKDTMYYRFGGNEKFDHRMIAVMKTIREKIRYGKAVPRNIVDPATILHEMRLRKDDADLADLRKACDISAEAHVEAMKHCKPGMYEYEIEAIVEYTFRKRGATGVGYNSIVGSGFNSTILHYNSNNDQIKDGDLVLIDAGAEYNLYSGDITRTFPANGKFTKAQRAVYEAVLAANTEVINMVKPGVGFMELHEKCVDVVTEELLKAHLLKGSKSEIIENGDYKKFFMHRTGHWLGMDVHDAGSYRENNDWRKLEPGMVFTVEPGIYIQAGCEGVSEEFYNIGVRIEDDIVVTENGFEVLTSKVPKKADEVEKLMGN